MCEPASIIAGVGLVISVTAAIVDGVSKDEANKKAKEAAAESASNGTRLLTLRQMQEKQAAQQNMFFADLDARSADAQARVSAGESGVAGTSVDIILDDIERQRLMANEGMKTNVDGMIQQLSQEKNVVRSNAQNQVNATPPNNWGATGLRIGAAGADAVSTYYRNKPSAGKKD